MGTFCLPFVRSDEIILFISPDGGEVGGGAPTALGQKAAELDQLIRGYLAERADVSARFRSFVGQARILKDPKYRLERLVYRGVQDGARPGHAPDGPPGDPGRRAAPGRDLAFATSARCSSRSSTSRPAT